MIDLSSLQSKMFVPNESMLVGKDIYSTNIDGLLYLNSERKIDERGYYAEIAKIPALETVIGQPFNIKQINQSVSKQNVIRGIHAEHWRKLITVLSGQCLSVIADVRPDSTTFGQTAYFLFGENEPALHGSLFLDSGLGNSFLVLEGPLTYSYSVDQLYEERDTSFDRSISVFDPDLAIAWPITRENMIISQRDMESKKLRELYPEKFNG